MIENIEHHKKVNVLLGVIIKQDDLLTEAHNESHALRKDIIALKRKIARLNQQLKKERTLK
jgi:hypothetical protein